MIPFWKGWCSEQTGELLSITHIIPRVMGSFVWLYEGFQFIGFQYPPFTTNSYKGPKIGENTLKNLWRRGKIDSLFSHWFSIAICAYKRPDVVTSFFFFPDLIEKSVSGWGTPRGQNYFCLSCPSKGDLGSLKLALEKAAPLCSWTPFIYSWLSLLTEVMFYKVSTNNEFTNPELLLLGETHGQVPASCWWQHFR